MNDPYDLTVFKGPVDKPRSEGGTGKKKPNRTRTSPVRVSEVRSKKVDGQKCRVCWDTDNLHAHHIVRRGAPWFGSWTENNIVALCQACHQDLHDGRDSVKQILRGQLTAAEVKYGDDRAYPGYVDDIYWRIRPAGANPGTLADTGSAQTAGAPDGEAAA